MALLHDRLMYDVLSNNAHPIPIATLLREVHFSLLLSDSIGK